MNVRTPVLLFSVLSACACSGGSTISASPPTPTSPSPPAPPSPPPAAPQPVSITITASGFTPSEVTTTVGMRVTFVNTDIRPHDLLGGPDHLRRECPEVDVVGFLVPGQSRETRVFETPQTCEFHDHNNLGNPAFQGRILVR